MNHLDFISNYRMELPHPWPKGGAIAIASTAILLLAMAAGVRAFAHGGDGAQFDFAVVAYDQSLKDAAVEFDHRGFDFNHIEYMSRHETCNEHGARQSAQNAHKLGIVSAFAFRGNYDYSVCGESSPCCSVFGANGSYRNGTIPENGYVDA